MEVIPYCSDTIFTPFCAYVYFSVTDYKLIITVRKQLRPIAHFDIHLTNNSTNSVVLELEDPTVLI
jgi:hypothetical protein